MIIANMHKRTFLLILCVLFMSFYSGQEKTTITGSWAMFKDRHPDGWGSFKPPYEYLIFNEKGDYTRLYINEKREGNWLFFGTYSRIGDNLIVFSESIGTNDMDKVTLASDTSWIQTIEDGVLELHEDWYTMFRKREKKWKHKKKFRKLTEEEQFELGNVTFKIMENYSKIEDPESEGL